MPSRDTLSKGWTFSQVPSEIIPEVKEEWKECSKVPTSVHVELIRLGEIEHPYKGLAEWDSQWVQEADWAFKTSFKATKEQLAEAEADLVFEGLDTYCDITVNGKHLKYVENMFTSWRIPVKDVLKEDNELVLRFKSPYRESSKEQDANGGPKVLWNGTPERLYSRKAGYHWGWDWGPVVMCVGPWRPVHLETYTYRLENIRIDTTLSAPEYTKASLSATFDISPKAPSSDYTIKAVLKTKDGKKVVKSMTQSAGEKSLKWDLRDGEVEAWWPVHYGKQPLYDLEISLLDKNETVVQTTHTRVAFRDAQVIQDKLIDQEGTTFLFQINGVRMFCGGSNWIPGDNFFTEMEPERYRRWVELMVAGNQNMLRVWGGGIFEEEVLYDGACDELGVLVWQDFMFGCGQYPSYEKINASIKLEAEQAVMRLRNHPSVVIFAGNNEDYSLAESLNIIDYSDESGDYMKTAFPARHIYEIILPEVVHRLSNVFYWRSSPYGGKSTADKTIGDTHQWNVWHGTQEPWHNWDILASRFISEFGMQGYPNLRTVKEWVKEGDEKELFPQSRISVNHNKAAGFERRLELYLMENFRHAFDMPSYVYYTQIMQAECLGAAYRLWRRNWKGPGREYTAGALVWQLNDCWPCVSWAICDYYLRPKPAFFAIARELRPYTVGMARKDIKHPTRENSLAFFEVHQELQLWGCNSTLQAKKAQVELISFNLDDDERYKRTFDVTLAPNSSTEIWKGDVPSQVIRKSDGETPKAIVVQARLLDSDGTVLARYSNWPEPWKYLLFPEPGLEIKVDGDEVRLTCSKPIKGVVLDVEGDEADWSDNGVDLFPGDEQVVMAKGLKGRKPIARYIGDGSA